MANGGGEEVVNNKQVIFKDYITGFPKESDMLVKTSGSTISLKLPQGSTGILLKNLFLSCDPYLRICMRKIEDTDELFQSFKPGSVST